MSRIYIVFIMLLLTTSYVMGQAKNDLTGNETMIDLYFKEYANQPEFQIMTMSESMVKNSNESGMWKHPSIARIMKQVKLYKFLNFRSTPEFDAEIVNRLDQSVKRDHKYEEYYRLQTNGATSTLIYTKGKKTITELVYITIDSKRMHISCFVGDDIDIESIRSLVLNK